jgi:hypothetical protein
VPVTAMFLLPGTLTTLALTLLRRRRGWTILRRGESAQPVASHAGRQFGLRHIMLWTLLAAIALAGFRAIAPNAETGANGAELMKLLAIFLGFGAIHTGVSLVTFACVGARPRWWTIVIATVVIAVLTALSAFWCILWDAAGPEVWPFSLTAAVHFVLLSISIALLRLAGYQFTRNVDTPAEKAT